MNQNREISKERTGLKIISLALAILLWFYVVNEGYYQVGQNNVEVNLTYNNVGEGLQVDGPDKVTVKLWGVFQETGEIQAYVNLEGKEAGVYSLPVNLQPVSGALFTSVEPRNVSVTLEQIQETIVPVNYRVTANPPAGYELLDFITEPERCFVMGDQDQVNQVTSVVCQVDLSNTTAINTFELKLTARDKDGNLISEGIEIIPAVVKAIVIVDESRSYKEVPIKVLSEGEPAEGYQLKSIDLEIETVKVVGSSLLLDTINEINTGKINISGINESFSLTVELQAPEGVKLYPTEIFADITIENIIEDEEE